MSKETMEPKKVLEKELYAAVKKFNESTGMRVEFMNVGWYAEGEDDYINSLGVDIKL